MPIFVFVASIIQRLLGRPNRSSGRKPRDLATQPQLSETEVQLFGYDLFMEATVHATNQEFRRQLALAGIPPNDIPLITGSRSLEHQVACLVLESPGRLSERKKREELARLHATDPERFHAAVRTVQQARIDAWFKLLSGGESFEEGGDPC